MTSHGHFLRHGVTWQPLVSHKARMGPPRLVEKEGEKTSP